MPKDELIAALEKATADSAGLMLEAWEHLCRTSVGFRRYACTSVDEYGLTVTGRFCRFVDAGAYESAALLIVPEGWRIGMEMGARNDMEPSKTVVWCWPFESHWEPDWQLGQQTQHDNPDGLKALAPTPALAIVIAALRATERGEAGR